MAASWQRVQLRDSAMVPLSQLFCLLLATCTLLVDPFSLSSNILTSFQVHQRGKPVTFYNLVTLSTVAFSPIIGGYITEKHGWRTQFYILAGFLFVGLLLLFFACPEHEYHRPLALETDVMVGELPSTREAEKEKLPSEEVDKRDKSPDQSAGKPNTYAQELKPFSKNISGENILILLARPFVCMLYPAVIWAFFLGGCWSTWVSLVLWIKILSTNCSNRMPPSSSYFPNCSQNRRICSRPRSWVTSSHFPSLGQSSPSCSALLQPIPRQNGPHDITMVSLSQNFDNGWWSPQSLLGYQACSPSATIRPGATSLGWWSASSSASSFSEPSSRQPARMRTFWIPTEILVLRFL